MTRPRDDRERGVVLLLVLWVFMTLGVLALDFSTYMRDDAMATVNLSDETRNYYLAVAGLNRAIFENNRDRQRPPGTGNTTQTGAADEGGVDLDGDGVPDTTEFKADGAWHEKEFGGGRFAVRLVGEDGRIPLNVDFASGDEREVYTELVKYVVTNLVRGGNQTTGVDTDTDEQIRTIVDSIVDWRDCDKESLPNGAEDDYYLGLPRPHRAKNGFFDSTEELLQVRGITPDIFYGHDDLPGLVDVFTPYPRGKELVINAGQVTPEVLRALAPPDVMQTLLDDIDEGDREKLKVDLGQQLDLVAPGLGARVQTVDPEIVRVEARADVGQPRNQAAVAAIVELGSSESDVPTILSWLDRAPLRGEEPGAATAPGPAGSS